MEKLDAYNTLTNLMAVFTDDEEIATKTPFLFVIQTPDGEGCQLIGCNTSHNLKDLVQVIIDQFVNSMKEAVKDGLDAKKVVGETLSDMCKLAMIKSFLMERLFASLPDECKELIDEFDEINGLVDM